LVKTFRETLQWIGWPTFGAIVEKHRQRHSEKESGRNDVTGIDETNGSHVFSKDKHERLNCNDYNPGLVRYSM